MKKFILIFLLSFAAMAYEFKQGRLIISDSNTIANETAALLELNSTTKGLLIPRLTTTEVSAMGSVTKGIIIYNSTIDSPMVSDGNSFVAIGGASLGDLQIITNTLESINTDQDINISPNGTGKVFIDTSLQVDNLTLNGSSINSGNNIFRLLSNLRTIDFTGSDLELKGIENDGVDRVNIKFFEPNSNGTNSVALRAPLIMADDYQITLPDAAPTAAGQVLTVNTIAGGTDAVLAWVTPTNDPTRINDGDNDTFVDTDLLTNAINMGATQIVMSAIGRNVVYDGLNFTLYGQTGSATDRGSLVLVEPDLNGSNRISLKAPLFVDNDYIIELPQNEGVEGQFLSAEAVFTDGLTQAVRLGWTNPFRIQDGDNNTYVDTAVAGAVDTVRLSAGLRTIDFTGPDLEIKGVTGDPLSRVNIKFFEPDLNGTNSVALRAPLAITDDYEITLPNAAPTAAGQVLSVNSISGGTDAVLAWATPTGGDSTRINDGADTTFVDTDATANAITWNAENGTADATCSATFDGSGFFDKNDFQFATCNSHIIRFTGTDTENATLRITDNGSSNTSPRFYFDVAQGSKWFIIRPPDAGGAFNNSELILPNDPPTSARQVLSVKTVVDTDTHETEWVDSARYCTMSEQYDVGELGQPHDTTAFNYTIRPFNSFSGDCLFLTAFAGEPIADTTFSNDSYYTGFQWEAGSYHIQCHTKNTATGLDQVFYTLYNNDLSVPASQCSEARTMTSDGFGVRFNCEITLASDTNLSLRAKTNSTTGFWSHGGTLGTTFGLPTEKNGQCLIVKYR